MQELQAIIKELTRCSLYQFKYPYDGKYKLMVLYFSPDDYHNYLGFDVEVDPKTNKNILICRMGKFYVDLKKRKLFFDNPDKSVEILNEFFNEFFNKTKHLSTWDTSLLGFIFPTLLKSNGE